MLVLERIAPGEGTDYVPPTLPTKSAIISKIHELDDFPKMGMVVDDNGAIEDKWGVEIGWGKSSPGLPNPDVGYVLTWQGLHRGSVVRWENTHSSRIKFILDFRTLSEATEREYALYRRKIELSVFGLLAEQKNREGSL